MGSERAGHSWMFLFVRFARVRVARSSLMPYGHCSPYTHHQCTLILLLAGKRLLASLHVVIQLIFHSCILRHHWLQENGDPFSALFAKPQRPQCTNDFESIYGGLEHHNTYCWHNEPRHLHSFPHPMFFLSGFKNAEITWDFMNWVPIPKYDVCQHSTSISICRPAYISWRTYITSVKFIEYSYLFMWFVKYLHYERHFNVKVLSFSLLMLFGL